MAFEIFVIMTVFCVVFYCAGYWVRGMIERKKWIQKKLRR